MHVVVSGCPIQMNFSGVEPSNVWPPRDSISCVALMPVSLELQWGTVGKHLFKDKSQSRDGLYLCHIKHRSCKCTLLLKAPPSSWLLVAWSPPKCKPKVPAPLALPEGQPTMVLNRITVQRQDPLLRNGLLSNIQHQRHSRAVGES